MWRGFVMFSLGKALSCLSVIRTKDDIGFLVDDAESLPSPVLFLFFGGGGGGSFNSSVVGMWRQLVGGVPLISSEKNSNTLSRKHSVPHSAVFH